MRRVVKINNGGEKLLNKNMNPPLDSGTAKRRWNRFNGKEKVRSDLLSDQFGLCAYTELRLDACGYDVHIEHVVPKSLFPKRTFDYTNLVLCALSSDDLRSLKGGEYFGGHHKDDVYDGGLFVSCVDEDSERFFRYLSTGKVEPVSTLNVKEKERAEYTIALLNLNSTILVDRRRRWLDELDGEIDCLLGDHQALSKFKLFLLSVDGNGFLAEFYSSICQRLVSV